MTTPDVLEQPQVTPEVSPVLPIAEHIEMSGFRADNQGDVAVALNTHTGTIGIVQPEVEESAEAADTIRKSIEDFFGTDFDPQDPRQSAWMAAERANQLAGELDTPVTLTFTHTYVDTDDRIRAVALSVGEGEVVVNPADEKRDLIEPVFHHFNMHGQLNGTEEALDHVQIEEIELGDEDRLVMWSSAVNHDITRTFASAEDFEDALLTADHEAAADKFLGKEQGKRDKIVLIQDIRPTGADVDSDAPEAGSDAISSDAAAVEEPGRVRRFLNAAKERWQNRTWFKRKVGRHALRAAGVEEPLTVAALRERLGYPAEPVNRTSHRRGRRPAELIEGYRAYKEERAARRVEAAQAGKFNRWDRWNAKAGAGIAALGGYGETFHVRHWDDRRYRDWEGTDYERHEDLEERRRKRGALVIGAAALALIAGSLLELKGIHTHHHEHNPHDIVVSPPGRHVPPFKAPTTPTTEAGPNPAYQHFAVPQGGGLDDRVYNMGHQMHANFTPGDAHVVEADTAQKFGGHQIVLDGHTADNSTYRYGNEWRISAPGNGQWAPGVEQFLEQDIDKIAASHS